MQIKLFSLDGRPGTSREQLKQYILRDQSWRYGNWRLAIRWLNKLYWYCWPCSQTKLKGNSNLIYLNESFRLFDENLIRFIGIFFLLRPSQNCVFTYYLLIIEVRQDLCSIAYYQNQKRITRTFNGQGVCKQIGYMCSTHTQKKTQQNKSTMISCLPLKIVEKILLYFLGTFPRTSIIFPSTEAPKGWFI